MEDIDFGPLKELIGVWEGNKGMDVSPDPNGTIDSPYYETIVYTANGDLENAKEQHLAILHYRQIVKRKSNDEVFHDQTGYLLWDADRKIVMHSTTIPRGLSMVAGGECSGEKDENGNITLELEAYADGKDWQIAQSPFLRDKAKTEFFKQKIVVGNGKMKYEEHTQLSIYGRPFDHSDENVLVRTRMEE